MKIIYAIIVVCMIGLSVLFVWNLFSSNDSDISNETFSDLNTLPVNDVQPEGRLVLSTNSGQTVYSSKPVNLDSYESLTPESKMLASTTDFSLLYYAPASRFVSQLRSEPLGEARLALEAFIKEEFGFTEKEMCDIEIVLTTNEYVNEYYAGSYIGFSFCPGSAQL